MSYLRGQIAQYMKSVAADVATEGWIYKSTRQVYSICFCDGLTLHCMPVWSFKNDAIATSQPLFYVCSDSVMKTGRKILDTKEDGYFSWYYQHELPIIDRRTSRNFVELETGYFKLESGYFPLETIPDYLTDLFIIAKRYLLSNYDLTSEKKFLASLPKDFTYPSKYWGWGDSGFGVFLLTRLMLGEEEKYIYWRDYFFERVSEKQKDIIYKLDEYDKRTLAALL